MTIKELEEKIKESAKEYQRLVKVLNELHEQESSLESQIEDLQDELEELREGELEEADQLCRWARGTFDDLVSERDRRIKLEGPRQLNPVVFRCG